MSALPPRRAEGRKAPVAVEPCDQFVVSYGKSGALGVFTSSEFLILRRGQRVLVKTSRGAEIGAVLCPASIMQARLLGAISSGDLLRCVNADDEVHRDRRAEIEQRLFDASRAWAKQDGLELEILDVDLLFDGAQAIVQFVGSDAGSESLAAALEEQFALKVRLENLAAPKEEHEHAHCDKPDCGRLNGGGGCTTCGTGGGCSTCGSGATDLREYFGHLRTKMESRIPLA
jgi:hypothetical protein